MKKATLLAMQDEFVKIAAPPPAKGDRYWKQYDELAKNISGLHGTRATRKRTAADGSVGSVERPQPKARPAAARLAPAGRTGIKARGLIGAMGLKQRLGAMGPPSSMQKRFSPARKPSVFPTPQRRVPQRSYPSFPAPKAPGMKQKTANYPGASGASGYHSKADIVERLWEATAGKKAKGTGASKGTERRSTLFKKLQERRNDKSPLMKIPEDMKTRLPTSANKEAFSKKRLGIQALGSHVDKNSVRKLQFAQADKKLLQGKK